MPHARAFIVGCATGWLWSPGRQSTPTANLASFYRQKPHYQHIIYGLQSDWLQHHPYHVSTQVIRGTQMFVLTRSWKNHKLFCNSYGKTHKLFVQFSETSHRLLCHHPSLSCKFHKGRGWGGGFPWPFQHQPFGFISLYFSTNNKRRHERVNSHKEPSPHGHSILLSFHSGQYIFLKSSITQRYP